MPFGTPVGGTGLGFRIAGIRRVVGIISLTLSAPDGLIEAVSDAMLPLERQHQPAGHGRHLPSRVGESGPRVRAREQGVGGDDGLALDLLTVLLGPVAAGLQEPGDGGDEDGRGGEEEREPDGISGTQNITSAGCSSSDARPRT
ncbi:hypothetical protein GM708_04400 [Vibrio cholerae]|nr:hypothetical protein [Vibrio cholerae]